MEKIVSETNLMENRMTRNTRKLERLLSIINATQLSDEQCVKHF